MKKIVICFGACCLFCNTSLSSQDSIIVKEKAISVSIGIVNLPIVFNYGPIIKYGFFSDFGPSIGTGLELKKSDKISTNFYLRYGFFNSLPDTALLSPVNPDPNSFEKYFDLQGQIHLFSGGCLWHRNVGRNVKLQPYVLFGGEILFKYRTEQTGFFAVNYSPQITAYYGQTYYVLSLNGRVGLGLKHKLSEKITLYEQFDASTMIFDHTKFSGNHFSIITEPLELLLSFKVGLLFDLE